MRKLSHVEYAEIILETYKRKAEEPELRLGQIFMGQIWARCPDLYKSITGTPDDIFYVEDSNFLKSTDGIMKYVE